jgi:hypothetical protein
MLWIGSLCSHWLGHTTLEHRLMNRCHDLDLGIFKHCNDFSKGWPDIRLESQHLDTISRRTDKQSFGKIRRTFPLTNANAAYCYHVSMETYKWSPPTRQSQSYIHPLSVCKPYVGHLRAIQWHVPISGVIPSLYTSIWATPKSSILTDLSDFKSLLINPRPLTYVMPLATSKACLINSLRRTILFWRFPKNSWTDPPLTTQLIFYCRIRN